MAKKVKLGSTKRYGTRYGRRNKDKVASLEKQHRGRHKCPYCNYVKVIRLAKGIWHCEKCSARFTGKAYTYEIAKKPAPVAPKVTEEAPLEEEETYEEELNEPEDIEKEDEEVSVEEAEPELETDESIEEEISDEEMPVEEPGKDEEKLQGSEVA
jgi:large subunit ribosomal protein L37Ae